MQNLSQAMDINYYNREKKKIEVEKVYGDKAVKWLYNSMLGKLLSPIVAGSTISKLYGALQSSSISQRKIKPFIEDFHIDMEDYLPQIGHSFDDGPGYDDFNHFFIRRFKDGKRRFPQEPTFLGAPSEARYFAYEKIDESEKIPVKGKFLTPRALINNIKWNDTFKDGPLLLARLCPVDYHRFHFPDKGVVLDEFTNHGELHSVNPIALKKRPDIFARNERQVTIIDTECFGKMAYIEIGATMVGKIVQNYEGPNFKRGQEKGYFLFGGSTVVIIGEKGKWLPDNDLLDYTKKGMETYLKLGAHLGHLT